jgi:hypothetical protein
VLNAARATDATTTSRSVKATTKPILVSGLENTMMSIIVYKTISPSLITRKRQHKLQFENKNSNHRIMCNKSNFNEIMLTFELIFNFK